MLEKVAAVWMPRKRMNHMQKMVTCFLFKREAVQRFVPVQLVG